MKNRGATLALCLLFILALCGGARASDGQENENVRVVLYEDRVMFVFLDFTQDQEYMARSANQLFSVLPDGVNKYLMIVPHRITFETEELRAISADEKAAAAYVAENLEETIAFVDAFDALERYEGSLNELFYRLDHHWTMLGAYYAADAFMNDAQIEHYTLEAYDQKEGFPFAGYMYLISGDDTLADNPDPLIGYQLPGSENNTADVYYPTGVAGETAMQTGLLLNAYRDGYSAFINEFGFSHAVIPGNAASGRALMLIGGSSNYALAPWLADNFNTVVLIETRFYEGGAEGVTALMEQYGITDVLLCVSFGTYIL